VVVNLTPQKKPKKAIRKSSSGIKINEPIPKASPAPTSPLGSGQKNPNPLIKEVFLLCLSFILDQFVICEPLCRVPQDINLDSSTKSAPVGSESPKVTKPPAPNTEDAGKNLGNPQA
jgi:hypothetical protein